MTLTNFEIGGDMISFLVDGYELDMHNCYQLERFDQNSRSGTATLVFVRGVGNWIKHTDPLRLTLDFVNVEHVLQCEPDADYPSEYVNADKNTSDIMGFTSDDTDEDWGVQTTESDTNRNDLMIITFVTGRAIKIKASSVSLHVERE
ncbi:MAG: hypothetical protein IPJ76_03285 [Flavobacteriales bacterium]|nr:MAG: hypothetical protein IPJ76_03285 [Flavobacteriales bacterium]